MPANAFLRELPFRIAELAKQFRYEKSGELTGLMRVRLFCLADAHIICQREQASDEIKLVLDLIEFMAAALGYQPGENYRYRLSMATARTKRNTIRRRILGFRRERFTAGLGPAEANFFEASNEAAFYGPKNRYPDEKCQRQRRYRFYSAI